MQKHTKNISNVIDSVISGTGAIITDIQRWGLLKLLRRQAIEEGERAYVKARVALILKIIDTRST